MRNCDVVTGPAVRSPVLSMLTQLALAHEQATDPAGSIAINFANLLPQNSRNCLCADFDQF